MDKQDMPYFHLLSDEECSLLEKSGATWGDIIKGFKQPRWCKYPDALGGIGGCWSLIYREVDGENYCKDCDLYAPKL